MKSSHLVLSLMLAAYLPTAQAGLFSDIGQNYQKQAQGFDDKVLIEQLNHPTWSWVWRTPEHILDEVKRRSQLSEEKATKLLALAAQELSQAKPASEYVVKTYETLLESAQAKNGMSGESVDSLIKLIDSRDTSFEIRSTTQTFIQNKLKINASKLSDNQKFDLLKLALSQQKATGFEQELLKAIRNSSSSLSLVLKSSELLFNYSFGRETNYKLNSERRKVFPIFRSSLLASHIESEKKNALLNASIQNIKSTSVFDKEELEILKVDIDLVTKYAPKEMIAQIADKLIRIMETVDAIDSALADKIASTVVKSYGSGGSRGGGGSGGSSGGSGGFSGYAGSSTGFIFLRNTYREYSAGKVSGAEMREILDQLLTKNLLINKFGSYSQTLDFICKAAARKSDAVVAKYCVNTVLPLLVSESQKTNRDINITISIRDLALSILTSLATYWDPSTLEVNCIESNNTAYKRAMDKFIRSLSGKTLKLLPLVKQESDFEFAKGNVENKNLFDFEIRRCKMAELEHHVTLGKIYLPEREGNLFYTYVDAEKNLVTSCLRVDLEKLHWEKEKFWGYEHSLDDVRLRDDLADVGLLLDFASNAQDSGMIQLGETEKEALNQWKSVKALNPNSVRASVPKDAMLLTKISDLEFSAVPSSLNLKPAMSLLCSKSKTPTSCRKNRTGSYSCDKNSTLSVYIKAKGE